MKRARLVLAPIACAMLLAAGFLAQEPASLAAPAAHDGEPSDEQPLVRCRELDRAARAEGDPARQRELFAEAARAYGEFFAAQPHAAESDGAGREFVALVQHQCRLHALVPGGTEALRNALEAALARLAPPSRSAATSDSAERAAEWSLALDRAELGIVLTELGGDRAHLARASGELERVTRESGPTSGPALNAAVLAARLERVRGDRGRARERAEFVAETAVPRARGSASWTELPFEVRSARFQLLELVLPDLLACLVAEGNERAACAAALRFHDVWRAEGFELTAAGHLALLAAARTLLDAGGFVAAPAGGGELRWLANEDERDAAGGALEAASPTHELALALGRHVSAATAGTPLEARTRAFSRAFLAAALARGEAVPPDVRLAVALDEVAAGELEAALASLEETLRSLDGTGPDGTGPDSTDEDLRRACAAAAALHLGHVHARLAHPREACQAFTRVATDPAAEPALRAEAARALYREAAGLRREAPLDAFAEEQFLLSERLLADVSSPVAAGALHWRQGERCFARGDYAGARAAYLAVPPAAAEHAQALLEAALCLRATNDAEGARRELERFLELVASDGGSDASDRADDGGVPTRASLRAQAIEVLAELASEARDHATVLRLLAEHESELIGQREEPNALFLRLQAELGMRNFAAARATQALLEAAHARHAATARAALALHQALVAEQTAADAAGDASRARALRSERAELLALVNRLASEPSFVALRAEAALRLELGDFVAAEELLRRTLASFAESPEHARDLDRFVRPDLARALLAQRRTQEAFALLDPLVARALPADTRAGAAASTDGVRELSPTLARDWCRAVTGWLATDGDELVEVEGAGAGAGGDHARAAELCARLVSHERERARASVPPSETSPAVDELELEHLYALYRWSRVDPARSADAKRLLDDFARRHAGAELDPALRARFRWLADRVR